MTNDITGDSTVAAVADITSFKGEYRFLSNFYPCAVELDGVLYPTSENAFQAAKTLGDRTPFLDCTPGQSKKLGREVTLRHEWDAIKLDVMHKLLLDKFTRHADLRAKLLATGAARLIEGNSWGDVFWGVDDKTGAGQNRLGRLLEQVRGDLAAAEEAV
jgi:ribA/ribD-fused uncharacterized protein